MDFIFNELCLEHHTGDHHPENKKRLEIFGLSTTKDLPDGSDYLGLIHPEWYIDQIREASRSSTPINGDTITSPLSYAAACAAVGATIKASEIGGFALVRPPGHHAYSTLSTGFCLFNNVAIAAELLTRQQKKVWILDIDGHLGDGTEAIFYRNKSVLFTSLHQYPAFPHKGFINEIGEGPGEGYTVNLPLPAGTGDDIFLRGLEALLPIAEQFQPDVVAISAGFDGHQHDLLLDLRLSASAYYVVGRMLRDRFSNIFAVLEGGYNLEELRRSACNLKAGINQEQIPYPEKPTESNMNCWDTYEMHLHGLISHLQKHWKF